MRVIDRDLIREGHYGQRSCEPHLKAEHMAAPTNSANVKISLANSEPSTHGGKADIDRTFRSISETGLEGRGTDEELAGRELFAASLCEQWAAGGGWGAAVSGDARFWD